MTHTAVARPIAPTVLAAALFFSIAAFPAQTCAQHPSGAGTPEVSSVQANSPSPQPVASKATLAQFAWLVGHWQGEWGPRVAQQVWMPPQAGVMVGVFQLSEDDHTFVVELYSIVSTKRGFELRVRHYTPSLTPWEKSGPAMLDLQSIDSKSILFENADDGESTHWLMKRTGTDSFLARFEIVPENSDRQIWEITYHRDSVTAPAAH